MRLAAASAWLVPIESSASADSPSPASLEIEFTHLRSGKGVLQICLTSDPANFPDCRHAAHAIKRTVSAAHPRIRIDGIPPGEYALAVIHDANGNARLDTMLGIPREGFGFSRDAPVRFGPPRFAAARFAVGTGAEKQQVRIRYLL